MRSRVLAPAAVAGLVGLAALVTALTPARLQAQQAAARPPAPPVYVAKQWWCELYAQPATGAELSQEEANRGFFFSQIMRRPHARRGEADEVERRCRASFEVQFGGKWTVVTARAFSAGTSNAAVSARHADMNDATRRGRAQEFRMSE
jgi:hypothetical protein